MSSTSEQGASQRRRREARAGDSCGGATDGAEAASSRVTYSPKVFIPLTMLCRDRCGYCTFAKAPARLESP
jgi:2-iminoacetate synthase ThiH